MNILRLALLICAFHFAATGIAFSQRKEPDAPENLDALRQYSLELVNRSRTENNLPRLELAEPLNEAALVHASDMLERDYFAHASPEGETARDRYLAASGSESSIVRENIARCQGCTPPPDKAVVDSLHTGWMNSPGHRENLLAEGLSHYGFAVVQKDGRRYGVETFAGPGMSLAASGEDGSEVIGAGAQTELALSLINELRDEGEVLSSAADLTEHIVAKLSNDSMAQLELGELGLLDDLPKDLPWRNYRLLAGQCGGCGAKPTAADVRFFVRQWNKNDRYREILSDGSLSHLGLVVVADGSGSKMAIAILAGS